jgi:hypothetical protein
LGSCAKRRSSSLELASGSTRAPRRPASASRKW